eukprot:g3043.t1
MLARRRTFRIIDLKVCWRSSFGKAAEGYDEDDPEDNQELKRKFSEPSNDGSGPQSSTLVKVRDFFNKYKPPPAPPPKAPKKEWLLRRMAEPEEVADPRNIPGPPIGDLEAEREWLNLGTNQQSISKLLVTDSIEFQKMNKEVESAESMRMAKRSAFNASQRYIPSFESEHKSRNVSRNKLSQMQEDWLNLKGENANSSSRSHSYERLNKRFDAIGDDIAQLKKEDPNDEFLDRFPETTMKQNQYSTNYSGGRNTESTKKASTSTQEKHQMDDSSDFLENKTAQTEADTVYDQIISEDLSEDVIYPKEKDVPEPYNYDPMQPRWLDPPDGEHVGAVPQREYNDFDPFKAEYDFWNESSVERFEDPGQDPVKPNRHKLFGQEYWVAKPMLMEKYDFGNEEVNAPREEPKKFKDMDREIPRHFIQEDGSLEPLSISETQEYSDFFDSDSSVAVIEENKSEEKLFTMSARWFKDSKKARIVDKRLRISNKVIDGYMINENDMEEDDIDEEVSHWLYEKPTFRDWGYDKSYSLDPSAMEPDYVRGRMASDGYGRYEKFIDNSKVLEPSQERIEEIKVLEGVQDPVEFQKTCNDLQDDEIERPATKIYYAEASDANLNTLMEAEERYMDIFTNEKSDELPSFADLSQQELLKSMQKLNKEDAPESRPVDQLLHSPSQKDFDPWIVNELNKCKKEDGKFEDLFSLACHPRMLEHAFSSLKNRRPGSVPRVIDNSFFEQASRILLMGELKKETMSTPKKPHKHAGRGARSRQIFSQPEKAKSRRE